MDFGGLKEFKNWLEDNFAHTLVIAQDDPKREYLMTLGPQTGLAKVKVLPAVGAERFAELAFNKMQSIIDEQVANGTALNPTVRVLSVECFEHGANSAIYQRD